MAKRNTGRKFRKYIKGAVNGEQNISGLGPAAANRQVLPDSVTEKTWISSIRAAWALSNYTPAADAGPLMVGFAHSDYTVGEIEGFLESVDSWNEANLVEQEVARRKIKIVGIFDAPDAVTEEAVLNDGKPIRTKLGWMLSTSQTVAQWTYNTGDASTSGASSAQITVRGHANLWPA